MRGLLIIFENGASRVEELSKEVLHLALDGGKGLIVQHAGCVSNALAVLEWNDAQSSWLLSPAAGTVPLITFHNGSVVPKQLLLNDGDSLNIGRSLLLFRRFPAAPIFREKACSEIPLSNVSRLCFGRVADAAMQGEELVLLDSEDRRISRRHLLLWRQNADFLVRDESPTGTFLNGQRFESHQLVVGDRFQLGGYSFEFTGLSLRRTRPRIGGKVEALDIGVRAGGRTILSDVTLRIEQCSFSGILGGSGQGKSTLLNALCGINPATSGTVLIEGQSIVDAAETRAAGIGFVPQDDIVHPELRVDEAVLFSARLRLDPRVPLRAMRHLVDETIHRLGLHEHRHKRIFQLSGGQRKRASIATELLDKPAMLFLDEPSSGLDPATEFALMKILRRLAAQDCTVICTTHVLGRAYLFDKIIFIHGGRVIFDGTPEQAYEHFQVESLDQVYVRLAEEERTGDDWAQDFKSSGPKQPSIDTRLREPDLSRFEEVPRARRSRPGFFHSLRVLIARQWSILAADNLNLLFLLAQPVLIAMLVGWVAEDYVLRMFLCVVATLWFGCSNGAQQIIKELPIFRRERICGLGLHAYLFSKYLFLGVITAFQALLLLVIVQTTSHLVRPAKLSPGELHAELQAATASKSVVTQSSGEEANFEAVNLHEGGTKPGAAAVLSGASKSQIATPRFNLWPAAWIGWFFELRWNLRDAVETASKSLTSVLGITVSLKLLALAATALAGVTIGLTVSGLVQNSAQAVMWVPLLLIPQILFGGVVLSLPELSRGARAVCMLIPSFSCERLMDVSNVYGQALPLLSNRTKLPLFLTPGEKETIRWTVMGRDYSESYDELSPANTSWQNLTVFPFAAGRHRHEYTEVQTSAGSRKRIYNETTETRDDVRYAKGRVFLNLVPVASSCLVLGAWIAVCYGATVMALAIRQKGK
ncbi:MAG TPA: ATP-binding cassette domain-containing protein [Terrimicrobiaceae bacterium]